jgi:hypothetical protein
MKDKKDIVDTDEEDTPKKVESPIESKDISEETDQKEPDMKTVTVETPSDEKPVAVPTAKVPEEVMTIGDPEKVSLSVTAAVESQIKQGEMIPTSMKTSDEKVFNMQYDPGCQCELQVINQFPTTIEIKNTQLEETDYIGNRATNQNIVAIYSIKDAKALKLKALQDAYSDTILHCLRKTMWHSHRILGAVEKIPNSKDFTNRHIDTSFIETPTWFLGDYPNLPTDVVEQIDLLRTRTVANTAWAEQGTIFQANGPNSSNLSSVRIQRDFLAPVSNYDAKLMELGAILANDTMTNSPIDLVTYYMSIALEELSFHSPIYHQELHHWPKLTHYAAENFRYMHLNHRFNERLYSDTYAIIRSKYSVESIDMSTRYSDYLRESGARATDFGTDTRSFQETLSPKAKAALYSLGAHYVHRNCTVVNLRSEVSTKFNPFKAESFIKALCLFIPSRSLTKESRAYLVASFLVNLTFDNFPGPNVSYGPINNKEFSTILGNFPRVPGITRWSEFFSAIYYGNNNIVPGINQPIDLINLAPSQWRAFDLDSFVARLRLVTLPQGVAGIQVVIRVVNFLTFLATGGCDTPNISFQDPNSRTPPILALNNKYKVSPYRPGQPSVWTPFDPTMKDEDDTGSALFKHYVTGVRMVMAGMKNMKKLTDPSLNKTRTYFQNAISQPMLFDQAARIANRMARMEAFFSYGDSSQGAVDSSYTIDLDLEAVGTISELLKLSTFTISMTQEWISVHLGTVQFANTIGCWLQCFYRFKQELRLNRYPYPTRNIKRRHAARETAKLFSLSQVDFPKLIDDITEESLFPFNDHIAAKQIVRGRDIALAGPTIEFETIYALVKRFETNSFQLSHIVTHFMLNFRDVFLYNLPEQPGEQPALNPQITMNSYGTSPARADAVPLTDDQHPIHADCIVKVDFLEGQIMYIEEYNGMINFQTIITPGINHKAVFLSKEFYHQVMMRDQIQQLYDFAENFPIPIIVEHTCHISDVHKSIGPHSFKDLNFPPSEPNMVGTLSRLIIHRQGVRSTDFFNPILPRVVPVIYNKDFFKQYACLSLQNNSGPNVVFNLNGQYQLASGINNVNNSNHFVSLATGALSGLSIVRSREHFIKTSSIDLTTNALK